MLNLLFLYMLLNLVILFIIVLFIIYLSFSYLQIAIAEKPQTILQKTDNDKRKNNDDKLGVVSILIYKI